MIIRRHVFLRSDSGPPVVVELVRRNHLKEATMKTSLRSWCVGSSLVVALTLGTFVTAQDKKADTTKAAEKKADAKKAVNRLPSNFGKLDLADAQKSTSWKPNWKHFG
jgi:hypothetical protein